MPIIQYRDLGRISFADAWNIQKKHFNLLLHAKRSDNIGMEKPQDLLLICEHDPVYTLGKNGSASNVIAESGLEISEVVRTDRGGDITFHGPGQVVGYPIFDLENYQMGLKKYIHSIEQIIIETISDFGLKAERFPGANGVWLDARNPIRARKICAIGVKCSRFVTMHGFAFNIHTNLAYFEKIVPCGIANKSVTSLEHELGRKVAIADVKQAVRYYFDKHF